MNIYPIKLVRPSKERNTKIVEWRLSNICNYDCSFCPSEFKNGTTRYLDYQSYVNSIDNLISITDKKVWFQFTGGEPTLYPRLIDLLAYIKQRGGYTSIISNGSRTLRWWKDLYDSKSLDLLMLTYHPEQTDDVDHIIQINNLFQSDKTLSLISVTTQSTPHLFQKSIDALSTLKQNADSIIELKLINQIGEMQAYSPEQLEIIQKNLNTQTELFSKNKDSRKDFIRNIPWYYASTMMLHYSDNTVKEEQIKDLIAKKLNKFRNWQCDIGKDLLQIETNLVYRAVCRQNGIMADLNNESVSWAKDSVVCQKDFCMCGLDLQEPKRFNDMELDNESR